MEKRMYVLVNRSLSSMQKGIQAAHAMIEYALKYKDDKEYLDWAQNWKTVIILDGGTSNEKLVKTSLLKEVESLNWIGNMENHFSLLKEKGINIAKFYEPDINDCLTAICFIVDEKVFNKEKYPDFMFPAILGTDDLSLSDEKYLNWCNLIGNQNIFLRDFLKQFKLAI